MTTAGKKANIKVSGTAVAMTNEAMSLATNGLSAQITNAAHRVLTPNGTFTVRKDTVAFTDYTLDRLLGKIVFDDVQAGTFDISGEYLPISNVSEAHNYSWEVANDWKEDLTYAEAIANGGWQARNTNGLKSASGTIGAFWDTDTVLSDALTDDTVLVLEFIINSAVDMRAWAMVESDEWSIALTDPIDRSISWVSKPDADGRGVSFT